MKMTEQERAFRSRAASYGFKGTRRGNEYVLYRRNVKEGGMTGGTMAAHEA
jgi:hypothetical protein